MKLTWHTLILFLPLLASAQFYYPDDKKYGSPADFGLQYDDVTFRSSDGTELHGWNIKTRSPEKVATIIHFHGNAQNMSSHLRGVEWLASRGFDLFLFDYRGYGRSAGKPDQDGVFDDCVAAIKQAQKLNPSEEHFIIYGQSLGAANAIAVVGETQFTKVSGVIAEAPFYSYQSISRDKVNSLLDIFVGLVISDRKSPHFVVQDVSPIPLLLVHGTGDRVIPISHSQKLFAKAKSPKDFWTVPYARHLGIFHEIEYQNKLVSTLKGWTESASEEP